MYKEYNTAKRLPSLAARKDVPIDQLADFDRVLVRVQKYSEQNPVASKRIRVDGQPYFSPCFRAWTNVPRLFNRIDDVIYKALYPSQAEHITHYGALEREMAYLLLGFDSGYWLYHAGHVPNAISAGMRIDAIQALADGHEEELTDEEAQLVEFIRAVLDGQMTDGIWSNMIERLGNLASVMEYATWVLVNFLHHRMAWAMGVPALRIEDFNAMMADIRSGNRDPQEMTQVAYQPTPSD